MNNEKFPKLLSLLAEGGKDMYVCSNSSAKENGHFAQDLYLRGAKIAEKGCHGWKNVITIDLFN
jgi:hypothetical protein